MAVGVISRHAQRALDVLRRAVLHHARAEVVEARIVVPAHADVRKIGKVELTLQSLPLGLDLGQQLLVAAVDVQEMHELIVRAAVEAHTAELLRRDGLHAVHAGEIGAFLVPHGELQVQPRQARAHAFLAEPRDGLARRVDSAQSRDQLGHVVDHEHGLSVDGVVIRLMEVLLDHPAHGAPELVHRHAAVPDDGAQIVGIALVPQRHRVVVRPHEIKLHAVAVLRLQEAVVQAVFQKRPAIVPVPVVDEHVHAVICGRGDLHLHYVGIRLVDISPQRPARPLVSLIALHRRAHRLPFAHALGPEDARSRLVAGIGRPDIGRHIVLSHVFPP